MPIRVFAAEDPDRFLQTDLTVWADGQSGEPTETVLHGLAPERRFAALSDDVPVELDCYAGVYGSYELDLSIPGPRHTVRQVPVGGLTWVGVHPDERRKGVLTAMMRDHFQRTAAADQTGLSVLHASEPVIYGRFGYGVASLEGKATLAKGAELTAPGLAEEVSRITTRLVRAEAPGVPARLRNAARVAAETAHGQVVRELRTYEAFVHDSPEALRDKEPLRALIATLDGADVGYAWFRRKAKWEDYQAQGTVEVTELVGTPAAQLALVRRLLDLDLMATVELHGRSRDDLVRRWLGTARATHGPLADGLWVRLVDLPIALAARGYAGAGEIVLEVTDDVLPDQGGRWQLVTTDDGRGRVERTDARPDVTLSTEQLAATYLGDGGLPQLLRAGRLTEHRPGAVVELDRLLGMPTAPAGAVGF